MARVNKTRKSIPQYAIIGDGFTEKIYFEQLREFENLKAFSIKPELPNKSGKGGGHVKLFSKCFELVDQGYERVFCLIDYDTVVSENLVAQYTALKAKILKEVSVTVFENNPCFEFWFLLHFNKTGKLYTSCGEVEKDLCKNINDYCKNQEYLKKKNIYSFLKPNQKDPAIPNAEFLEKERLGRTIRYPRAEVYKLINEIVK